MSKSKNFQYPRTIMFDTETLAQAKALQDNGRNSVAHVVRAAIRDRYNMMIDHRPTCANGGACHCPHTHTFPPR
jgi:hypothetical protein